MSNSLDALRYTIGQLKMGCDIHWHSETKKEGKWVCDQAATFSNDEEDGLNMANFPNQERDYWLFGLLQQMCTEWPWSFPNNVFVPDDISSEVKAIIDGWDVDGHSHGCLTRAELKAKREELKPLQAEQLIRPTEYGEALAHHAKRLDEIIAALDSDVPDTDQRLVFFFDN